MKNTNKIVPIKYNKKKIIAATAIVIVQAIMVTLWIDTITTYVISAVAFVSLVVIFFRDIIGLIKFALGCVTKILKRDA